MAKVTIFKFLTKVGAFGKVRLVRKVNPNRVESNSQALINKSPSNDSSTDEEDDTRLLQRRFNTMNIARKGSNMMTDEAYDDLIDDPDFQFYAIKILSKK